MRLIEKLFIGQCILTCEHCVIENLTFNVPGKLDAFNSKKHDEKLYNFIYNNDESFINEINNICGSLIFSERNGFYHHEIYKIDTEGFIWIEKRTSKNEVILAYKINSNWNKWTLIHDMTKTNGRYAFEYLGKIFSYSVLNYGGLVLHGVLMEYNGKGIIISAPSGTGKTTHARMWRDIHNVLIINGDRALCSIENEKWTGYGMPWCGTSGEYINRKVPIEAIVVIEQDEENGVERLSPIEGFIHMMPNLTAPTWEESLMTKGIDQLKDMVENIPVFKLKCKPDEEAVEALKKEIDRL